MEEKPENFNRENLKLALERTHLAWIRTVMTLYASGFAIDKITALVHNDRLLHGSAVVSQTHYMALTILSVSIILLILQTVFYLSRMISLNSLGQEKYKFPWNGFMLSVLLLIIGIILISVIS